jgi:hypothetical protein
MGKSVSSGDKMKRLNIILLFLVIVVISSCIGEEEKVVFLKIDDSEYEVDDFRNFLQYARPSNLPPYEEAVLDIFLEDFLNHRLLYKAALDNNISGERQISEVDKENVMVAKLLADKAYYKIRIREEDLQELYEERFTQNRVNIRSIYFSDQNTANTELRRLKSRPRDFEKKMEQYNPEEMTKSGLGVGIFTKYQMPENVAEVVFKEKRPTVVGPVDVGNGFLVIQILEFLEKPALDEVRKELEDLIAPRERVRLKKEYLAKLKKKYEIEFHPELVKESEEFVINTQTGENNEN